LHDHIPFSGQRPRTCPPAARNLIIRQGQRRQAPPLRGLRGRPRRNPQGLERLINRVTSSKPAHAAPGKSANLVTADVIHSKYGWGKLFVVWQLWAGRKHLTAGAGAGYRLIPSFTKGHFGC